LVTSNVTTLARAVRDSVRPMLRTSVDNSQGKGAKARPNGKKLSKAARGKAVVKRTVARVKPKRAPAKKRMKQPTAPALGTVAVEVIEQPAPGVITVGAVEETELRKVS
jgi:hypothetical protein